MDNATEQQTDRLEMVVVGDEHGGAGSGTTANLDLRDHDPVVVLTSSAPSRKGLSRLLRRRATDVTPPSPVHACPTCGRPATIDLDDGMRGRLYLSCGACARMWQVKVDPTIKQDEKEWMVRD